MTQKLDITKRGELVKFYAFVNPDKPAVISDEGSLTWSQLYRNSRALAQNLYGLGLRPGDRAAVMIYNMPQFWQMSVALSLLAVGMVPVGYRSKAPEIEYIAGNSEAKCIFFHEDFGGLIMPHRKNYGGIIENGFICIGNAPDGAVQFDKLMENPPDVDLDNLPEVQPQGMIYTSGTTGKPKGAFRKTTEKSAQLIINIIQKFKYASDEVHLVACPLYHSAPLVFSASAFILGGTLVLMRRFDTRGFLENASKYGVTSSFVVPTILDSILHYPEEGLKDYNFDKLRTLICGAAPLFPRIKTGILDRFGPVLYEFYGSTETGVNTLITPDQIREKPDSVGQVFPENELVIFDENGNAVPDGERGELYIYNPFLMEGYYKNEQATRECRRGKYMTVGDIAIRDKDGFYYIVDRKKDMIIRGGANVYPAEVEQVIHGMPGVMDVAVVGKPDEHWGETVAAFVVPDNGAKISGEDIKQYCADKLASYKIPENIIFRDEIPRSPQGKILKRLLKEELN